MNNEIFVYLILGFVLYIIVGFLRLDIKNTRREYENRDDLEIVDTIIVIMGLDLFWTLLKSLYKLLVYIGNKFESLFR